MAARICAICEKQIGLGGNKGWPETAIPIKPSGLVCTPCYKGVVKPQRQKIEYQRKHVLRRSMRDTRFEFKDVEENEDGTDK